MTTDSDRAKRVLELFLGRPNVLFHLQQDADDHVVGPWEKGEGVGVQMRRGPSGSIHAEVWKEEDGWVAELWGSQGDDDDGTPMRYRTRKEAMGAIDDVLTDSELILVDGNLGGNMEGDKTLGLLAVDTPYDRVLDAFLQKPDLLVAVLRRSPKILSPWEPGRDRGGPWDFHRGTASGNEFSSVCWESRDWGPERWFLYAEDKDEPQDLGLLEGGSGREAMEKADRILREKGFLLL